MNKKQRKAKQRKIKQQQAKVRADKKVRQKQRSLWQTMRNKVQGKVVARRRTRQVRNWFSLCEEQRRELENKIGRPWKPMIQYRVVTRGQIEVTLEKEEGKTFRSEIPCHGYNTHTALNQIFEAENYQDALDYIKWDYTEGIENDEGRLLECGLKRTPILEYYDREVGMWFDIP